MNVFQIIKKLSDNGGKRDKRGFSPAEQIALIALEPFLEVIGARIIQMIDHATSVADVALTATEKEQE